MRNESVEYDNTFTVPGSCDEPANEDEVPKSAARCQARRLSPPQLTPPWQLQSAIGPLKPDQFTLLSRSKLMVRTLSDTIKSSDLKKLMSFNLIVLKSHSRVMMLVSYDNLLPNDIM